MKRTNQQLQSLALLAVSDNNFALEDLTAVFNETEEELLDMTTCLEYHDEVQKMGVTAFTMKYFVGCDDCE